MMVVRQPKEVAGYIKYINLIPTTSFHGFFVD